MEQKMCEGCGKEMGSCQCGNGWHGKWMMKGHRKHFGGVYCLIVLGAAVYYLQHSMGFWAGVLGILKALVWPAMIAYKAFGLLNM